MPRVAILGSIRTTLEMIKWEHSVFALPFALAGALLAAGGWPRPRQLLWITVAMVAARSAAMAFNRLVDHAIDRANPRTQSRALPAGAVSRAFVTGFVLASSALFVLAAAQLNRLSRNLAPVALAILLGYSYTKRFTRWSHLVLGFTLGISPAAAWIAVRGSLDPRILLLTAAVTFWVAGFDILYSCLDYDFDRRTGLHSLPCSLGVAGAMRLARWFHGAMLLILLVLVRSFHLGEAALVGVILIALLLGWEHSLVRPSDLSRLDAAFFTMNGVISVLFLVSLVLDLQFRR